MDKQNPGPLVGKTTKQQLQKGGGGGKKRKPSESTEYFQFLTRLEEGRKTKQQQEQGRGSPYTPQPSLSMSSSPDRGQQHKLGNISGLQSLVRQLRKLEKEYQQQNPKPNPKPKPKPKQGQKFKS